jgi:hydrogenase nickel incorporation protein HypA/HybF
MHELSIVMSIIETVQEELIKHDAEAVETIELDIGNLSGIEMHAFDFAWNCGIEQSILKNAKRVINRIEGTGICKICNTHFHMQQVYDACPVCKNYGAEIIRGKELKIQSLTLTRKKN